MPTITLNDGGQLYYEDTASEKPPLMLVTGLGGQASFWSSLVDVFAKHWRVITHDHRGCGKSSLELKAYSVDQMATDALELMDALSINQTSFVGHSTGGAIGQIIAIDHPDRIHRLVLSSTWPQTDAYFRKLFQSRAEILRECGQSVYTRLSELYMFPPSHIREHGTPSDTLQIPSFDVEAMLNRIQAIIDFDRLDQISTIQAPTLTIVAQDDMVTPAYFSELLTNEIPNAKNITEPNGGHFLPLVHSEAYLSHVIGFLKQS